MNTAWCVGLLVYNLFSSPIGWVWHCRWEEVSKLCVYFAALPVNLWFILLSCSSSLLLTLHPRVILQSWTTQNSATSSPRPWRTKEMCCLATCPRYMNFTIGRWNTLCTLPVIYFTVSWKRWNQLKTTWENGIWSTKKPLHARLETQPYDNS